MAIEIEKKFILTPQQENALLEGAEFLSEKKFTDIYYDNSLYFLTSQDMWLRERDARFELKVPVNDHLESRISDQYRELGGEQILEFFRVDAGTTFEQFLDQNDYRSFCKITTKRRKYHTQGFVIDLDVVDFGYIVAEIEFMTEDSDVHKAQEITDRIINFAKQHNINTEAYVRGKVAEFLYRYRWEHYQALVKAKVLR